MERKPNFFIIGAAKSGTTSLFHYIQQHPDVFMSDVKEPHYFCSPDFPERFQGVGDEGFSDQTIRTRQRYLNLFRGVKNERVIGEASVYYLVYPNVAQRIKDFNPNAKMIVILRNPVERAFSAYMHTIRDNRESLSFEKALQMEAQRKEQGYQPLWWYTEVGYYAQQLAIYMSTFAPEQLKVFLYEDLRRSDMLLAELLQFLELRDDVVIDTTIRHNVSGAPKARALYDFLAKPNIVKEAVKPFLPPQFRQKIGHQMKNLILSQIRPAPAIVDFLKSEFREDILNLQDLIHRDLSAWLEK
ncbi:sulfotransferase family protein [Alicyclobacillus fodiniaquatilis]|uniref:Sulfotransferase family protein n=1 Tax=Alicyclobacillus fodiniaquatilis TaxID=1661150 RepID=A0ABW4JQA6_9BACL